MVSVVEGRDGGGLFNIVCHKLALGDLDHSVLLLWILRRMAVLDSVNLTQTRL